MLPIFRLLFLRTTFALASFSLMVNLRATSLDKLPENPSTGEITHLAFFSEGLVPSGKDEPSGLDNQQLLSALKNYSNRADTDDFSALESYLAEYPESPWSPSVRLNLGLEQFTRGYYSKAISSFEGAWKKAAQDTEPRAKVMADRAFAELVAMHARLGHKEEIEKKLMSVEGRDITGSNAALLQSAKDGLWMMKNKPADAFQCGPFAVGQILVKLKNTNDASEIVKSLPSTDKGTSLTQLANLAQHNGLDMVAARRDEGAPFVFPAVVHWKLGHYAALLDARGGSYLVEDMTFATRSWISAKALDLESSGKFLVRRADIVPGWQILEKAESDQVWGKGASSSSDADRTTPDDKKGKDCPKPPANGMPVYNVNAMLVSLVVWDTPVGYQPPRGPDMNFTVTYNQRENNQPANFTYANLGTGWSCNWLSYISDDGGTTSNDVKWMTDGGGAVKFKGFSSGSYAIDIYSGKKLSRISATRYEMTTPQGVKMVFSNVQGVSSRRIFMTSISDETGLNTVTLGYDANARLITLTDAVGYITQIKYNSDSLGDEEFLKIKTVTDPFNRSANFYYTAGRLTTIGDTIGLSSSFGYDPSTGFMNRMTTPYGDTLFSAGQTNFNVSHQRVRWLEVTDPENQKERYEFNTSNVLSDSATRPSGDVAKTGLSDPVTFNTLDGDLADRTVYYWDKKAMSGPHGYGDARITHFTYSANYANAAGGLVASIKSPLTSRIWYNYPNQIYAYQESNVSIGQPSRIARVTDDGTTEMIQREYNSLGNPTKSVDALGRETRYIYGNGNDVDVTGVEQKISSTGYQPVLQLGYGGTPAPPPHRPRQMIDASLQVTNLTYNAFGQVKTVTNPKNEVTTYIYDGDGYLTGIDGPLPGSADSVSFAYKITNGKKQTQISQTTDTEGYAIQYGYDDLNRLITATYPDGTWSQIDYNRLDPVWNKDRLNRWTQRVYDGERRLTKEIDPLQRLTQFMWCGCGALESLKDGEGHMTTFIRDLEGRLISKIYADNKVDQYVYLPSSGRLDYKLDPKNQYTRSKYYKDGTLKQISYTDSSNQPLSPPTPGVSLVYDPYFPRLTTMTDGSGSTQYAYNPITGTPSLGAMLPSSVTSPLPAAVVSFTYDELGRPKTRSVDGTFNLAMTYDPSGRVTNQVNPLGTFGSTYVGSSGRPNVTTNPNSTTSTYVWYPNAQDQRLNTITYARGATLISKYTYGYNAEGQILNQSIQNDALATIENSFGYDAADQLTSALASTGTSTALQEVFGYDKGGNRNSIQAGNSVESEISNNVNQLSSKQGGGPFRIRGTLSKPGKIKINGKYAPISADNSFEATPNVIAGQLNSINFVSEDFANPPHTAPYQYQINVPAAGTSTYSHDNNGNLTGDAAHTYEWDAADRLVKINYLGSSPVQSTQFAYDGLSRRIIISETLDGTTTAQRFLWNGEEIIDQRDSGNVITKKYYPQGFEINGVNLYYTRDHLGSIREITDINGYVVTRYGYGAWGNRSTTHLAGNVDADFGYTGHYEHTTSGLVLTHYRAYNPVVGRWLSRDPIGEEGGINLYGYVGNNPVNAVDPLGLSACDDFVGQLMGEWGSNQSFYDPDTVTGMNMLDNRNAKLSNWDGFRSELVSGGQNGKVASHIRGHAGAIMAYGDFGRMRSHWESFNDWKQGVEGKHSKGEANAELADNRAARKVADAMSKATKCNKNGDPDAPSNLRDQLKKILCK